MISCIKTCTASRNLFADSLCAGNLSLFHFTGGFQLSKVLKLSCSCTATTKWNTTAVEVLFLFSYLNCLFCFSSRKVSQRDSSMAAFLLVFDNLMQVLTAENRKNHLTFQIFNYSCSSTAVTKWNIAAIKILQLFKAGLFIWFFGWGKRRHRIQGKWMLNRQGLTAEYREGFWPHLLALRSCIQGLVSVSNNWSVSLDSVLL